MRTLRNGAFVLLGLFALTLLFIGRWQTMPATVAQTLDPPTLHFEANRLWAPLEPLLRILDAKLEVQDGRRVVCKADRCLFLESDALRPHDDQEWVDVLWLGEMLSLNAETLSLLSVNQPMSQQGTLTPDFSLPGLDGKPHRLSEFRGKKTIVYIWGSW